MGIQQDIDGRRGTKSIHIWYLMQQAIQKMHSYSSRITRVQSHLKQQTKWKKTQQKEFVVVANGLPKYIFLEISIQ